MLVSHKSITYGIWIIHLSFIYINLSYINIQSNTLGRKPFQKCSSSVEELQHSERPNFQTGYSFSRIYATNGSEKDRTSYIDSTIYKLTRNNFMKLSKLDFIPNMKNPCFYVHNPPLNDLGMWVNNDTVIKCWPAFQLIGVEKCGTTDLFNKLHLHHHLLTMTDPRNQAVYKEPQWYSGYTRKVHNYTLGGYLSLMDNATKHMYKYCIEQSTSNNGSQCPYMVSDFSARTMNHNYHWYKDEANEQFYFPKYLTADKVHHVFPQAKLLVILRNPTDRLISDYNYYRGRFAPDEVNPNDFHTRVLMAINMWNHCTNTMRVDVEKCAEGFNWTLANNMTIGYGWDYGSLDKIRVGLYSVFLKRWLQLFPMKNIHVIKMEEYSSSPLEYMENHILPFLGLEPFQPETVIAFKKINEQNSNRNNEINVTMLNSTRVILDNFFAPYNLQLAEMLHDDKFLWKN